MFADSVMHATAARALELGQAWSQEAPIRIHSGEIASDGSPQWHRDFSRWMTRQDARPAALDDEPAVRVKRAFGKLRKISMREFEVCYQVLIMGRSIAQATSWLNERAERNGIPTRYRPKDTLALLVAGLDWVDIHR